MDDLTAKILAEIDEQEQHPERFAYTVKCPECGSTKQHVTTKADVAKARERRGIAESEPVVIESLCDRCDKDEDDA